VTASTPAANRGLLLTRAIPKLGRYRLDELSYDGQIADWVGWLEHDLKLAPATVRRYHTVVDQCMKAAVGKHIPANPLDPSPGDRRGHLPKAEKYEACFLTPQEAYLIIPRCSVHIRDMVEVALVCAWAS